LHIGAEGLHQFKQNPGCVISAWGAGIQVHMDISRRILGAGHPRRHDKALHFRVL